MKIGILPCQGACNVGVMTNKVALEFVEEEKVSMVCPLGLPLGIDGIINNAKTNDNYIALNGCPVKCASKALASVDINQYKEIIVTTDFDIEKNKNFKDETKINLVKEKVNDIVNELQLEQEA